MNPKTTPKDFFLWAGAMVALYWSVIAFILLMFDYINYALPNALQYQSDPYQGSIPYDMASIVVLLPLGVFLMWLIRRDMVADASRAHIWVRRWALIFTLFIAGLSAAVDLIILLTTFFRGEELTVAFLLKVLVVLLVAAVVFMHFIADLWEYWAKFPARARSVGVGIVILGFCSIGAGFLIVGTPGAARLMRFDDQKVSDLGTIQNQIIYYYQRKQALPQGLDQLSDPISGFVAPRDSQTGQSYEYRATGALSFELCASFNASSSASNRAGEAYPTTPMGAYGTENNWQHAAGRVCFSRPIDPQLYPPTAPQVKGL